MNTRTHILVAGCTATSHIYPSLALIRELVNRGYRVSYSVGASLAGLVAQAGAEPVLHRSQLPTDQGGWPQDPVSVMRVFLGEAMAVLPRLRSRFDRDRPDLVLSDIGGMAGPVLAARYGVPAVQLSPTLVPWDGYERHQAEVIESSRRSAVGREYYDTYGRWLVANDINVDPYQWQTYPGAVLTLFPRAMQPYADRVSDSVRFVGPCLDPVRLTAQNWTAPENGRPVLLISFGTAYTPPLSVYRACVQAFVDSDWQVVLVTGPRISRAELGRLPGHIEVHQRVEQLAVLRVASAFVTHAGMGSCAEALWFGVPMVAIPQAVDQFGNAETLARLGVGRNLPAEQVTASRLRAEVDQLAADDAVRRRLAELRTEVRANGGVDVAADVVQAYLT